MDPANWFRLPNQLCPACPDKLVQVFYCLSVCKQAETADKMHWLNQIKSHSSVEENAIMIARAINNNAKLCVGHIESGSRSQRVLSLCSD